MNNELIAGGPVTVASCFELYKFHKQQKKKWTESMERARKRIVDVFKETHPGAITQTMCEDYIEKRLDMGLAQDTVRIEMAYLRAALRYAAREKMILAAPFIKVPAGGDARERWLTEQEIDRLIDGAVELHVKLFIILSVTTAARPSHILQLLWSQVDLDNRIINYRHVGVMQSNKQRPRVPINETGMTHLRVAFELRRTDHVIERNGKAGFKRIYKGITEAARRAGLEGVSPYVLRHTAGVWMAKAGRPMEEIAALMGHKDLKTTMKHYAHYHPSFLRGAASALEIGSHRTTDGPELSMVHDGPQT